MEDNEVLLLRLDNLLESIFNSVKDITYSVSFYEEHKYPYEVVINHNGSTEVKAFIDSLMFLVDSDVSEEDTCSLYFKDITKLVDFLTQVVSSDNLDYEETEDTPSEEYPEDLSDISEVDDSKKIRTSKKSLPKKQQRVKTTVRGDGTILTLSRPGKDVESLESIATDLLQEILSSKNMENFSKLTKIININMF